jgi:hypothetical protein
VGGSTKQTEPDTVQAAAADIFVQCFPLLLADVVRRAHPLTFHQFLLVREDGESLAFGLAEDDMRVVVTSAWIDLSEHPVIVRLPHTGGRYLSLTLFDTLGEPFESIGSRTGDDSGVDLALIGPSWRGELPSGLRARRAPSDLVWAVSRIHAHSILDRGDALALARQQCLATLPPATDQPWSSGATVDSPSSPSVRQVSEISPEVFFHRLDNVLRRAPAAYLPILLPRVNALRAKLDGPPPPSSWTREFHDAVCRGFADGMESIAAAAAADSASEREGWSTLPSSVRHLSTSELGRAAAAFARLGAPIREDLLSLICDEDEQGRPLSGAHAYRIHFPPGAGPPVKAFWWLSARPPASHELQHGLGSRSDLSLNPDGSLDIFAQREPPPAPMIPNWLPSPEDGFSLIMRLYSPRSAALGANWRMPPVERLESGAASKPGKPIRRWRPARAPPQGGDYSRSVFQPTTSAWRALS